MKREKSLLWARALEGTPIVAHRPPVRDIRWVLHYHPFHAVAQATVYSMCVEAGRRHGEPWRVTAACFSEKRRTHMALLLPPEGVLSPERLIVFSNDFYGNMDELPKDFIQTLKVQLSLLGRGLTTTMALARDLSYFEGVPYGDGDEWHL